MESAANAACFLANNNQKEVTRTDVCDTESVIIAIRKTVLQKYGAQTMDCATQPNPSGCVKLCGLIGNSRKALLTKITKVG